MNFEKAQDRIDSNKGKEEILVISETTDWIFCLAVSDKISELHSIVTKIIIFLSWIYHLSTH